MARDPERGACVALSGTVGQSVSCSAYDSRPAECRVFEAGSDRCRAVRRAYHLEPPLTAEAVDAARRHLRTRRAVRDYPDTVLSVSLRAAPIFPSMLLAAVRLGNGSTRPLGLLDAATSSEQARRLVGLTFDEARSTFVQMCLFGPDGYRPWPGVGDSPLGFRLRALFGGASDEEIARELGMRPATVTRIVATGRLSARALALITKHTFCDRDWLVEGPPPVEAAGAPPDDSTRQKRRLRPAAAAAIIAPGEDGDAGEGAR